MISRIEAIGYRCLRSVSVPLRPFQILVGPNGSGKSTLLDVVRFLGDVVRDGLQAAISARTTAAANLTWQRIGTSFELAVEAVIPETCLDLASTPFRRFHYAVGSIVFETAIHAPGVVSA